MTQQVLQHMLLQMMIEREALLNNVNKVYEIDVISNKDYIFVTS